MSKERFWKIISAIELVIAALVILFDLFMPIEFKSDVWKISGIS